MKKNTIIEIITISFVILFLYTGISKLMDYSLFKEQIATSPLLAPISKQLAWILPLFEFFTTILLVVPRWRLKGLISSLILMTLFTIYIIGILLFNKNLPCSCGGVLAELSWGQHLVFNGVLIAFAITGITLESHVRKSYKSELAGINSNLSIQA